MEKIIEKRQEVLRFLQVDEYLDGDNYIDRTDCDYGSSAGRGNGYGSGSGSGYEFGSGTSEDHGYGNGYGWGCGNDSSIEVLDGIIVHEIDNVPTLIDSVHGNFAKGRILSDDLTTKPCYIAKCGNFFAHGKTLEDAVGDARIKYEQSLPVEERIKLFNEQYPDRDKPISAKELFVWHSTLTGSCLMGRKQFCKEHGIDYENGEYTVNFFLNLTKDAYGGNVIKQLMESKP